MRLLVTSVTCALLALQAWPCMSAEDAHQRTATSICVTPLEVVLHGPFDRVQLVITRRGSDGTIDATSDDLTGSAQLQCANEDLIRINDSAQVTAQRNGTSTITVVVDGETTTVPVKVSGMESAQPIDFLEDVRPVLSKAGCAAGACHAAQHGQGGFKLSVFGFDPVSDYEQIAIVARGRRISPARPDASLLLAKPTMRVPHGGGLRLDPESIDYQLLWQWIRSGSPSSPSAEVEIDRLEVFPKQRVDALGYTQQLRVVAYYPDGSQRDVTALAVYDAIDTGIVNVTGSGLVTTYGKGQTSVMVRYEGQVATSTFVVPFSDETQLADWQSINFIDVLAAEKFSDLGLQPSPVCDDATFIRRAYLDAIGSLPEPQLVAEFVESKDAKKRSQLIDRLLGLTGDPALDIYNDRYAAFWTLRWSDLIRNNSASLGEQGMWAMHNWIRDAFRQNKPFDRFVYELVTAKGSIYSNGPANFFRVHGDSSALTEATSQLFMGVRLECAKCHQHPFESISQSDYYSMSAFFSRVASKTSEDFGLFGRETIVMVRPTGEVVHPRTRKKLSPKPVGGEVMDDDLDRRIPFAQWLTSSENEYFARSVVNRYMGYLLGKGLVEPVDDMRSTNPPSNQEMLDALTKDFVEHHFDLKHLMRTIMNSRLYALSSQPTPANATDHRFYSHYNVKRLAAEPLLDAIDQATGVATKFRNLPLGTRAIELPDAEYPDYFLNTFAKPRRASVCECERSPDANLAQALHTINGEPLVTKIASKSGRIAKLLAAKTPHDAIVRELYLAALCRYPTVAELETSNEILAESKTPSDCYHDLLWALINSKQFLFVH